MEYNRIMAYIYVYDDGRKKKNTGFARIELRGSALKTHIGMKNAFSGAEGDWNVCYFFRDGKKICLVKVGMMTIRGGIGEYDGTDLDGNIGEKKVFLSEIRGLCIWNSGEKTRIFASEWDDLGFDVKEMIWYEEWEKSKKNRVEFEGDSEKKEVLEVSAHAAEKEEVKQEQVLLASQMYETEKSEPGESEDKVEWDEKNWMRIFDERQQSLVFSDDDLYDCVEITPEDIYRLTDVNWGLKNNSFLNHGYYNFHHLLLGKIRGEKDAFFIGVPGVYTRRDRNTASMYGFDHFKFSMRSDFHYSQFGYWYRRLE